MRHRTQDKKFGRSKSHREALMASLVCALIERKRIQTTLPKAKEARQAAERLVTMARKNTLAGRRIVAARIRNKACVTELFETIAPKFVGRPGGYTRILKLGSRDGDGAEMALLEWVDVADAVVAEPEITK